MLQMIWKWQNEYIPSQNEVVLARDPALHARAVEKIRSFVTEELGRECKVLIAAPITRTDGNRKFLAWVE